MRVWVQPAEWNGPEDEWPIEQLDVTVVNFLGDKEIPGPKVIGAHAEPDAEPCTSGNFYNEDRPF